MTSNKPKIIVVLGPTSVGKTDVAINIARKFSGEIISADSRQIYKGMDIGTGKVTEKELQGIPYHLIDVLNPGETYSAAQFKNDAEKLIEKILSRDNLPIIEGGTGFYISTITEGLELPNIPPNPELRKKLRKKNLAELFEMLKKSDPERAKSVDKDNKVRLIRALEITEVSDEVPSLERDIKYDILQIGLDLEDEELRKRIKVRLEKRLEEGMIEETENLLDKRVRAEWLLKIGLEYRYITRFLKGEISREEMVEEINNKSWQYAKRQRTWFKKDERIKWFNPNEINKIEKTVRDFLKT